MSPLGSTVTVDRPATGIAVLAGGALLVAGCGGGDGAFVIPAPDPSLVPEIEFSTATSLSRGLGYPQDGQRGRLVRLVSRMVGEPFPRLLAFFEHGTGPEVVEFDGAGHPARDLFVTFSSDDGDHWSSPVNLSSTAQLWSRTVDMDGDPGTPPVPYHGTVDRSSVAAHAARVVIAWLSRYAPGGAQGSAVYPDAGGIEVPHASVQAIWSRDGGTSWSPVQRLTDARRDASNLMVQGGANGFALVWQEDPRGLQPGEGEGPGDGGSGARVSPGTDIWVATMTTARMESGQGFAAPIRFTDNLSGSGPDGIDTGWVGASRPQVRLIGPSLVVAYEETKNATGSGSGEVGKVVRYHVCSQWTDPATDPTLGAGWIVSDPDENARRVRLLAQGTPGPGTGLRFAVLWRQGTLGQGAPADIMIRVGRLDPTDSMSTGLRPQDLEPGVVPEATTLEGAAGNSFAGNISSSAGMSARTSDLPDEDSRAHRGYLRGDALVLGWTHTPNATLSRDTDQVPRDFLVRRSLDGGRTWEAPLNLSRLPPGGGVSLEVAEPRLVPTPGSAEVDELLRPESQYVAWVTAVQVGGLWFHRDIYLTRSEDLGSTYRPLQMLAGGPAAQSEPQLVCSPDGRTVHAVWFSTVEPEGTAVVYRRGRVVTP